MTAWEYRVPEFAATIRGCTWYKPHNAPILVLAGYCMKELASINSKRPWTAIIAIYTMVVRGWPYSENNGMGNSATLNMTQSRQKQKHRRHTLIAYTRYLGQQDWRQKERAPQIKQAPPCSSSRQQQPSKSNSAWALDDSGYSRSGAAWR